MNKKSELKRKGKEKCFTWKISGDKCRKLSIIQVYQRKYYNTLFIFNDFYLYLFCNFRKLHFRRQRIFRPDCDPDP